MLFFIFIICLHTASSAPVLDQKLPPPETISFMKKFGYIKAGEDTDALYTEDGFREAVKQMQKFGGLPQTGELDNATLSLTTAPRCGIPDIVAVSPSDRTKRYIIGSEGWKKRTLSYFLANWSPEIDHQTTADLLKNAFKMWSNISPLRFVHRDGMDADLIVAFGRGGHGDGYPFDGPGRILAHAFFPYEFGPYGGDIHFDDDEPWIDGSKSNNHEDGVDFFTVATHEIGHSLGLAHSTVPGSIMFPYYKGYNKYMQMDYDDIVAMHTMYVLQGNFEDEQPSHPDNDDNIWDTDDVSTDAPSTTDEEETDQSETDREPNIIPDDESNQDAPYFPEVGNDVPDDEEEPTTTDSGKEEEEVENEEETKEKVDVEEGKTTDSSNAGGFQNVTGSGKKKTQPPDICQGSLDAASLLRGELFVFKGLFLWRLHGIRDIAKGYPVHFHVFFRGFPWSVRSIDAVYERPHDYHIVFFAGSLYWIFDGNSFTPDSPKPLTELGISADITHMDAALVWEKNKKTYLFSGDFYWRLNETSGKVENNYPQRIQRWKGVPKDIDAAFTWTDAKTYFFKDKDFWRFNNQNISVDASFPFPIAPHWFDCSP